MMHVEKMKLCTIIAAPEHTLTADSTSFTTRPTKEVTDWLAEHGIWDGELIAQHSRNNTGQQFELRYAYYFANERDAIMFALRWS